MSDRDDEKRLERDLYRENITVAGIHKRVISYIVDTIIMVLLVTIMFNESQNQAITDAYNIVVDTYDQDKKELYSVEQTAQAMGIVLRMSLSITFMLFIYDLLMTYYYGATLGKMLVKIRVINTRSLSTPRFIPCLSRSLSKALLGHLIYISFFYVITKYRKCLHDKIAETIVVNY